MKISLRLLFLVVFGSIFILLPACNNKTNMTLVDWTTEDDPNKLLIVLDSTYTVAQEFSKSSNLTETHYTIQINHQDLHIRERDFRAPFLIYNGKLYFSKSRILKGKLSTPQDLFIYFVDLKTILK
jgi:hypothetical protein